jgi:very-short-patch-repair endonuclease
MNNYLKEIARELRKNMTPSEKILWTHIRKWALWEQVLRQKVFYVYTENSWRERYIIPDFYIAKKKLIIEVDWWIHKLSKVLELDKVKEELILQRGFKIIRFTNQEVQNNIETVIHLIKEKLI